MEGKLDMIAALLEAVDFSSHGKSTNARRSIWQEDPGANTKQYEGGEEVQLPKGWKKHYDSESGKHFYQNTYTQEVQWDLPCEEAEQW